MIARLRELVRTLVLLVTLTATTGLEALSSWMLTGMGFALALPGSALNPAFEFHRHLLSLMSEAGWASAFLTLGLSQTAVNLARFSDSVRLAQFASAARQFLALCCMMMFLFLSDLAWGTPQGIVFAIPAFGVMAVGQLLVFLRIADMRHVKKQRTVSGETTAYG